jgi:hypothetical protein
MDLRAIARALDGDVCGRQVLAPGPGHSKKDRSLSIRLNPSAPGGFVVFSHAGDDWRDCRDHVSALAPGFDTPRQQKRSRPRQTQDGDKLNIELALDWWKQSLPLKGTFGESYLKSRSITCDENLSHVVRFHPNCVFANDRFPALVALVRNIETNEPQAVQRTALDHEGRAIKRGGKTLRMSLGRTSNGAIKIDDDADVTYGLSIGEGLETTLSGRIFGYRPAWAVLSASAIAAFPVLNGIQSLTVFGENDASGANERAVKECSARWKDAGREVFRLRPLIGNDLNDELQAEARNASA